MSYSFKLNADFTDGIINKGTLLDDAVDWIKSSLEPEDVFDESDLEDWAIDNGFETKA